MSEALRLWRLFPNQIQAGLSLHHHRHISEWHRADFTLSSRELLVLLDELPETSKFKEASERTFWVAEYKGDKEELKGELLQILAHGRPPSDVEVIAEYVDWTYDRKLLARNTLELANLRADGRDYQPDTTGLVEPLTAILITRRQRQEAELQLRGRMHIESGLYANC